MYLNEQKPALSLRSKMLRPADYPEAWLYSQLHPSALEQLVAKRRELVSENQLSARPAGRILAIEGGGDWAMGEGTSPSAGIIDDTYLPPWDTWFACLMVGAAPPLTFLLAWIPLPLVAAVQAAMDVSASQHLEWLDESSSDFLRQAYQELTLS